MPKTRYHWDEFNEDIENTINILNKDYLHLNKVYGIPKGGLIISVTLANHLPKLKYIHNLKDIDKNTLIVDDILDSGDTLLKIPGKHITMTLFCKVMTKFKPSFWWRYCTEDDWICFPWESFVKEEVRDGTVVE